MLGPLEAIAGRYPWARLPLERAVAAFGEDRITELAVALEKQGSFSRAESHAVDIVSGLVGQALLGQQPPPLTKRSSIFLEPKGEPEDDRAA